MGNILVVQLSRLGDIIQSVPLLTDIRAMHPRACIYLLANEVFEECQFFLSGVIVIPLIFEKFVVKLDDEYAVTENDYFSELIRSLDEKEFELVVNLNNSSVARKIAGMVACKNKYGFGSVEQDSIEWGAYITSFLKTRELSSVNLVDVFRRFVRDSGSRNQDLGFRKQKVEGTDKCIGLQCGARNIKRQFTLQHYLDIVNHYLGKGYKVYLLGMASESAAAESVTNKIRSDKLFDMTGKTDLKQLIEIISKCERIYTPDTGTMHLSALYGVSFTALFYGPAYPFETLAYSGNAEVYMPAKERFPCYPCNDHERCDRNFECHGFSFQKVFNNEGNSDFCRLSVEYDEVGQLLSPIKELAKLWRRFTRHYFYDEKEDFDIEISEDAKRIVKRELRLWKMMDINDLEVACENFYFLRPLVYVSKMVESGCLVNKAIEFFECKV